MSQQVNKGLVQTQSRSMKGIRCTAGLQQLLGKTIILFPLLNVNRAETKDYVHYNLSADYFLD